MTLEELRNEIDVLDRQIGHLKAATSLPVYEPAREKVIYANVRAANNGPLPDIELTHIYERIIDVMRALQRDELASERNAQGRRGDLLGHGTGAETQTEAPETGIKQ
jgi:chorismate mutase